MTSRKRFARIYLPPLIYAALIFGVSCFHYVPVPTIDRISLDKLYHVAEFTVFGYLLMRAWHQGKHLSGFPLILLTIIIGAGYGVSDEVHQLFVPGRFFSYWDMAADAVGTVVGSLIYLKVLK